MFRKRPLQGTLFETSLLVPPAKARRLQTSWAETFRERALPLIEEERFASLYNADQGRPNRPVSLVLGVLLLKEMSNLTDQEALAQLEFSLLWQHALQVPAAEAHLSQKTLHNFRAGLMAQELAQAAFAETTDRIVAVLGTKVERQRLDSTQVLSNIAVLTRLGLFCETLRVFLVALRREHGRLSRRVPAKLRGRYVKEDEAATAYGDARSAEGRRRLAVCARDVYRLCQLFGGTAAQSLPTYGLLQRLLAEQCQVVSAPQQPAADDDDRGDGGVPVVLREAKTISSASLQSPHDPGVTYSAHKGKGYAVQVAETCDEDNLVELITQVAVTDACVSDAQATVPTLEALAARDQLPAELVADTAYGSAENAVVAQALGTAVVSPVSGSPPAVAADAVERGLSPTAFQVDPRPEAPAICPAGHFSLTQVVNSASPTRILLTFDQQTCEACSGLHSCPIRWAPAVLGYQVTVDLLAANLAQRRRAEASGEFKERYAIRAGIEATHSELKRRHGLGKLRVRGRPRVVLAVHLKALACNLKRLVWALMPAPDQRRLATA